MKTYLAKNVPDYDLDKELNAFSLQGWEIFSVEKIDYVNYTYFYTIITYKNE